MINLTVYKITNFHISVIHLILINEAPTFKQLFKYIINLFFI